MAAFTPALGLRRVVGILTRRIAPVPSRQTTSVKVPPISTPISNFPVASAITTNSPSVREMTRHRTRSQRAERRLLARAQIGGLGAARAKAAARGQVARVGRLALQPEIPG